MTVPEVGWVVRYWLGDRERTGRICYVGHDTFDVRWSYGGRPGTDTIPIRSKDWHRLE